MVFWQLQHQSHSLQIDNLIYSSSLTQFFTVGVKYASVCGGGNYYKCATWTLRRKSKRKHCCVFFLIWRCGMSNLNILCHILYCYSPLCVAARRHFEQKKVLQHTGPSNGIWINFARWCKIATTSSSLLHPSLHQFAQLFLVCCPHYSTSSLILVTKTFTIPLYFLPNLLIYSDTAFYPICWFNHMPYMPAENKYLCVAMTVLKYFVSGKFILLQVLLHSSSFRDAQEDLFLRSTFPPFTMEMVW